MPRRTGMSQDALKVQERLQKRLARERRYKEVAEAVKKAREEAAKKEQENNKHDADKGAGDEAVSVSAPAPESSSAGDDQRESIATTGISLISSNAGGSGDGLFGAAAAPVVTTTGLDDGSSNQVGGSVAVATVEAPAAVFTGAYDSVATTSDRQTVPVGVPQVPTGGSAAIQASGAMATLGSMRSGPMVEVSGSLSLGTAGVVPDPVVDGLLSSEGSPLVGIGSNDDKVDGSASEENMSQETDSERDPLAGVTGGPTSLLDIKGDTQQDSQRVPPVLAVAAPTTDGDQGDSDSEMSAASVPEAPPEEQVYMPSSNDANDASGSGLDEEIIPETIAQIESATLEAYKSLQEHLARVAGMQYASEVDRFQAENELVKAREKYNELRSKYLELIEQQDDDVVREGPQQQALLEMIASMDLRQAKNELDELLDQLEEELHEGDSNVIVELKQKISLAEEKVGQAEAKLESLRSQNEIAANAGAGFEVVHGYGAGAAAGSGSNVVTSDNGSQAGGVDPEGQVIEDLASLELARQEASAEVDHLRQELEKLKQELDSFVNPFVERDDAAEVDESEISKLDEEIERVEIELDDAETRYEVITKKVAALEAAEDADSGGAAGFVLDDLFPDDSQDDDTTEQSGAAGAAASSGQDERLDNGTPPEDGFTVIVNPAAGVRGPGQVDASDEEGGLTPYDLFGRSDSEEHSDSDGGLPSGDGEAPPDPGNQGTSITWRVLGAVGSLLGYNGDDA